jgi:HK97 family phage major capsid protein
MKVFEIRERAVEEAQLARDIKDKADAETRGMTAEEASEFDKHLHESERLEQEAARQEKLEATEARLNAAKPTIVKPELANGARIEVVSPKMYRYGELRAFKGANATANAYRAGRFLAAVLFDHGGSRQWCRDHGVELRQDTEPDTRAMSESINTAGGFVVPDEMEASIIDLREQYGVARQQLRIAPMGTDHSNEPKKIGGLAAYPVGEGVEITESEQSWGNVEMTARKWGVLTRISTELSEDALVNLGDDLTYDAALAFATAEDEAAINGDGTSNYHGIVGIRNLMIDGNHTGSYVDATNGCDNWSEITDAWLLAIMAAIKPQATRRGAAWHCSSYAAFAVFGRLLRAAAGNNVQTLAGAAPTAYNGYPIVEWPSMPEDDSSAALNNKIMLLFGNLRASSKMGVRRGITVLRLLERYAEKDQIGIRFTERFTINHHSITGAASTTRGPVCGLLGGT